VKVEQIRQVDGSMEFCQEFFDDVVVPITDVVGEIDDGWTVATRLLTHERSAVGGSSMYTSGRSIGHDPSNDDDNTIVQLAKDLGLERDDRARQLVAEAQVRQMVGQALIRRISGGIASGKSSPASGSMLKLFTALGVMRRAEIGLELAGRSAAAWPVQDPQTPAQIMSEMSLWRQGMSLGGGSNEIQRNIISERVLGMPREYAADREIPYREVKRTGN
jgi:alkylation response protein AidB-like acyl-CoA dehydrogenase